MISLINDAAILNGRSRQTTIFHNIANDIYGTFRDRMVISRAFCIIRVKRAKMCATLECRPRGKGREKERTREIEIKKKREREREKGALQRDTLYFGLILLKADRISRFHSSRGQCACVPFSISLPFYFSHFLSSALSFLPNSFSRDARPTRTT